MKPLITRQELSQATGLSVHIIRHNEQSLGLTRCKVVVNRKLIFYRSDEAIAAVERRAPQSPSRVNAA